MDEAPDIAVLRHASEAGQWTLWRKLPPLRLQPHVLDLVGYVEGGGQPLVRRELPFAGIPLILVFRHHFSLFGDSGAEARLAGSFVAGLTDRPTLVGSPGQAFCMQVNFTPMGARRILGIDLSEIGGRVVAVEDLLGRDLEDRLSEARSWSQRFAVLEARLSDRLQRGPTVSPLAERAYGLLAASGGRIDIGRLTGQLEVSRKHLARLFRRDVGMTPKAVARLLRFERALGLLRGGRARSVAEIAYACGYADQSHFTGEFRSMSGQPPRALLRHRLPDGSIAASTR